jgi:hypothetical protein
MNPKKIPNIEALPPGARVPVKDLAPRWACSPRTLDRWIRDPKLEFPRIVYIRNRRYITAADALEWERKQYEAA